MSESIMSEPSAPRLMRTSRRHILRGFLGGAATAALVAAGWSIDAAARPQYLHGLAPSPDLQGPLGIVVVFNNPVDPAAFEEYYLNTHVPLALRMPLLQRLDSCKAVSQVDGHAAAFHRMATLHFASHTHLEEALASEEGISAFADVPNFATGGATATIARQFKLDMPKLAKPTRTRDPRTPF